MFKTQIMDFVKSVGKKYIYYALVYSIYKGFGLMNNFGQRF